MDGSVVIIVTGGCVGGVSSPRECRKSPVVAVLCWCREVVFTVIHRNIDVEVSIVVESHFSTGGGCVGTEGGCVSAGGGCVGDMGCVSVPCVSCLVIMS